MSKLLQKLNFTTTFKGTLQLSQRTLKQKETTVSGIMGILSVSSAHWHFSGSIWRIILEHLLELLHKELCIISPNLALIQFTWGGLKQVTNSPLVHAPFVMLDALARFLVSSDMYSSSLWEYVLQAKKKPSWEMQNLNLHNCKMNPFFLTHHLIRASLHFHFSMLFINTNKRWTQILMQQRLFDHDKY